MAVIVRVIDASDDSDYWSPDGWGDGRTIPLLASREPLRQDGLRDSDSDAGDGRRGSLSDRTASAGRGDAAAPHCLPSPPNFRPPP